MSRNAKSLVRAVLVAPLVAVAVVWAASGVAAVAGPDAGLLSLIPLALVTAGGVAVAMGPVRSGD